jgi:branched-chain amino acid transport system ATP-binding protein
MVEQNAARALEISDYAFVLELGQKYLEGTGRAILEDPSVKERYLGGGTDHS